MWQDGDVPEHYRVWRREDGSPWRLGNGAACKATDLRTDDIVVLRFFDAPVQGPGGAAAMARLGQLLSRPRSPRVAALRDLFIREHTHLAVTEYIEGESLADRVRQQGALPTETVWAVVSEALEALTTMHEAGVAHGSFGPSKLLFPPTGGPLRVVDGGLHPGASSVAPTAGSPGTADDLRRLGMTAWLALTGSFPFAEGSEAPENVPLRWQPLDAFPASTTLRALLALFARTLTSPSNRRPQTADALLRSLEAQGFEPRTIDDGAANREASRRKPVGGSGVFPGEPGVEIPADAGFVRPAPERQPSESTVLREKRSRSSRRVRGRWCRWRVEASLAILVLSGATAVLSLQHPHAADVRASGAKIPATSQAPPAPPAPKVPAAVVKMVAVPPVETQPVSGAGIQARAVRLQTRQPATLDALKLARELRRVATVPVTPGQPFPDAGELARLGGELSSINPGAPNTHRTALVLVLGCADEASADGSVSSSQEEADALAAALAQDGVTAPIYACGVGSSEGLSEVDRPAAGEGDFVEVWVAFLLF